MGISDGFSPGAGRKVSAFIDARDADAAHGDSRLRAEASGEVRAPRRELAESRDLRAREVLDALACVPGAA